MRAPYTMVKKKNHSTKVLRSGHNTKNDCVTYNAVATCTLINDVKNTRPRIRVNSKMLKK